MENKEEAKDKIKSGIKIQDSIDYLKNIYAFGI
jgi:hypothetical protein